MVIKVCWCYILPIISCFTLQGETQHIRGVPTYESTSQSKNGAGGLDLSSKEEKYDNEIIERNEFSETTFTDIQENDETSLIQSPREVRLCIFYSIMCLYICYCQIVNCWADYKPEGWL